MTRMCSICAPNFIIFQQAVLRAAVDSRAEEKGIIIIRRRRNTLKIIIIRVLGHFLDKFVLHDYKNLKIFILPLSLFFFTNIYKQKMCNVFC